MLTALRQLNKANAVKKYFHTTANQYGYIVL